ncbi:DUF4262 domain-containing protein [Patulibacter sp. SYSU D01012]|uniref:DUF4262 domain-containing protein n=1 Tax=Patulibacter sp. SYSU D01012 TaxID=2817381 RepID=UPI001B30D268|nr:DUF4262 domain-containing protein [Patulibacter sp. SYSU D01012]
MQPSADPPLPEPADDVERRIAADVREHGWHAVLVRAGDHPAPVTGLPLAYTAGLWLTMNHPELVLVGDFAHAHAILAGTVDVVRRGGRLLPGAEVEGVIEGAPLRTVAVDARHRDGLLEYARWTHKGRGFQAVQLLVPDGAGRWPGDDGYAGVPQPSLVR